MTAPLVTLLVATRNTGKLREFRALFSELPGVRLVSLADLPELPDVIEDGATFEANARKKASEVAQASALAVLADDSGLEVDALGGHPGVHSARYAGLASGHAGEEPNNDKLLQALAHVDDGERTARYRVVLAFADPTGPLGRQVHTEDGVCEGTIRRARNGTGGFGYDPLFQPHGYPCTMAELDAQEKNRISHRALATRKMQRFLASYLLTRGASA